MIEFGHESRFGYRRGGILARDIVKIKKSGCVIASLRPDAQFRPRTESLAGSLRKLDANTWLLRMSEVMVLALEVLGQVSMSHNHSGLFVLLQLQ